MIFMVHQGLLLLRVGSRHYESLYFNVMCAYVLSGAKYRGIRR